MAFVFKLDKDLPPGFKENSGQPHLPALATYLEGFNGGVYETREDFEHIMKGFYDYLRKNMIREKDSSGIPYMAYLCKDGCVGASGDPDDCAHRFGELKEVKSVVFRLRTDMPPGFVENESQPLLPEAVKFLEDYDGKEFIGPKKFQEELDRFNSGLEMRRQKGEIDGYTRSILSLYVIGGHVIQDPGVDRFFGNLVPAET